MSLPLESKSAKSLVNQESIQLADLTSTPSSARQRSSSTSPVQPRSTFIVSAIYSTVKDAPIQDFFQCLRNIINGGTMTTTKGGNSKYKAHMSIEIAAELLKLVETLERRIQKQQDSNVSFPHLCLKAQQLKQQKSETHPIQKPSLPKQGRRGKEFGQITQDGIKNRQGLSDKRRQKVAERWNSNRLPRPTRCRQNTGRIINIPSLPEKIKPIHVRQNVPKCIVYGLEPEFTKDQMEEALSQSFVKEHKDMKVMFPIKGRTRKIHWVFQTPGTIYRQLRRRQKLTMTGKPIQ
ncbi:hypothetical protein AVEN_127870-1 [Araneus ventricosus]|uniref:Uncharacterized protein n=1 Tax=Araneus ventricosus TaxID=182803 RepID=A0A4Y1ZYQ5_ARAVE|nr:hypothetical protein AVEN_127870-1 [Araneus ventricosus]